MNQEDLILTVPEAARLLKVGRTTLRDHIRAGEIPHLRLGRKILLRRDALMAWMEQRERESVARLLERAGAEG